MGEIFNIFGIENKIMGNSGIEKIFFKFLHALAISLLFILLPKKEDFCTKLQFSKVEKI